MEVHEIYIVQFIYLLPTDKSSQTLSHNIIV